MDQHLLGEYDCRRDDRGRLRLPSEIVNRHSEDDGNFVLRKGLDDCLVLFPMKAWERESQRINTLDDMIPDERRFRRMFFQNSKGVKLDGNKRVQIPSNLADRAGIDRDVVILGVGDRYEIWDKAKHASQVGGGDEFSELASKIFGSRSAAR